MGKRSVSLLLALALVLGMIPGNVFSLFASAAATADYEAAYASSVTVDGTLSETAWLTTGRLSGGQPFDILWDKDNLYFAVVPNAADSSVTVSVGSQSVSVTKSDANNNWGTAVEVKVPYSISSYGVVENVNIAMGASNWSGNVAITSLERTQKVKASNLGGVSSGSPTATSDGSGYTFTLAPAATAPDASVSYQERQYAYGTVSGLGNHTEDLSIEFDFAATALPDVGTARYMGSSWPQWAGPTFILTDHRMNGLNLSIQNAGGNLYVCSVNGNKASNFHAVNTGKKTGTTVHLRMVWRDSGDVEVYADGSYVGVLPDAAAGYTYMRDCFFNATNTMWVNLIRRKEYYDQQVTFTVSNITVGNAYGNNALEALDFADIAGSNTDQDAVTADLSLPASYTSRHFGQKNLTWTSSNPAVISNTGKVTRPVEDTLVTLTASDGSESASIDVTVAAASLEAFFVGDAIAGALTAESPYWPSAQWKEMTVFNGTNAPEGTAAALISGAKVYLAVKHHGATSVSATLGTETETAALTADGTTVLCFDATQLLYYGQKLELQVTLTGSNGATAKLWNSGVLEVSGNRASAYTFNAIPNDDYKGSNAAKGYTTTVANGVYTFSATAAINNSVAPCLVQRKGIIELIDTTKDILFTQELCIQQMGVGSSTGSMPAAYEGNGYTILLEYVSGTKQEFFPCVVAPNADGELFVQVMAFANYQAPRISLGKSIGDTFQLTVKWCANKDLVVYVDGVQKGVVENTAGFYSSSYASSSTGASLLLKYRDPVCSTTNPATIISTNPRIGLAEAGVEHPLTALTALESELAAEVLLPGVSLDSLGGKLNLPATGSTMYLGSVPLTWTWTGDTVVDAEGNVLPGTADKHATLTLSVGDHIVWTADVTVPTDGTAAPVGPIPTDVKAYAATEAITVDGDLSDVSWAKAQALNYVTSTGVSGRIYTAWAKGKLYLGADYTGATAMRLTLGEKTWTLDLTAADIASDDGLVTGKVKDGILELSVDMLAAGIEITAYNQTAPFQVILSNGYKQAALTGEATVNLVFANDEAAKFGLVTGGSTNITTITDGVATFKTDTATRQYYLLGSEFVNHAYDTYLEQTICVNAMTNANAGAFDGAAQTDGYYFLISDKVTPPTGTSYTTYGVITFANLWNNNGNLTLKVNRAAGGGVDVPLGKTTGEEFTLGYLWTTGDTSTYEDDTVEVYVDGVLVGTVHNVSYEAPYVGQDTFVVNSYCVVDMTVKDIIFSVPHKTAPDAYTLEDLLVGIDTASITANLPAVFENGHFAYNVDWNSSNTAIIADNGTVSRPAYGGAVAVKLNPVVGGVDLGTVDVTVNDLGMPSLDAYLFNGAVTLDGQLTEKGWILPLVYRTNSDGTTEKFFAHWKGGCLLLAMDCGDASQLTIKLGENSKTIDLTQTISVDGITGAVKDGVVELSLPVSALGINLSNYNDGPHAFNLSLDGTKLFSADLGITFTGIAARTLDFNTYSYKTDNVTVVSANQIQFPTNVATRSYWGVTDIADGLEKDVPFFLEQTLNIASMATTDGSFTSDSLANGYCFWIAFRIDDTTTGDALVANLFNDATNGLTLRIRQAGTVNTNQADVVLGRKPGDGAFTLGVQYDGAGGISVYVDDEYKGTVENTLLTSVKYVGRDAIMLNNIVNSGITVSDLTLHILRYNDILDEITPEKIFGDIDLTAVTEDLPLVTAFVSENLGTVSLRWESSNPDVVAADGTITPAATADIPVTLSLFVGDSTTALWTQDVTVKRGMDCLDAILSQETMVVDGNLTEQVYVQWHEFMDADVSFAAAWARGTVYFAVNGDSAATLELTINGKVVVISLADGTVTIDGNASACTSAKNTTTGLVEVGIALSDLGIALTDYNQYVPFQAKAMNGAAEQILPSTALNFSGKVASVAGMGSFSSNGHFSASGVTASYNGTQAGAVHYTYKNDNPIDHTQIVILSQDLEFNYLPGSGNITGGATAEGFYAWFNDGVHVGSSTQGTAIFYTIFADNSGNLSLRLGNGKAGEGTVYALNRSLNQKFRLTFIWNPDDVLEIYVDGALLAAVANASYAQNAAGADVITYRYYAAQSSNKVKFAISNVSMLTVAYETMLDELTKENIFGRIDLTHVRKDLPMVTSYNSANFESLGLYWETSNPDVVAADGTITRHGTEYGYATVSAYYVAPDGTKTWLWDAEITVDPMTVGDQEAPGIIHTAFAPAGTVNLDGAYTDEGWLLNGWVLDASGSICSEFGAQWDQSNLYLVIDYGSASAVEFSLDDGTNGKKTFTLDISGKSVLRNGSAVSGSSVAISGTVAEIKLPLSAFTDSYLDTYDTSYAFGLYLTIDGQYSSYTGDLILTSVDWWLTDDKVEGMTVQSSLIKSIAFKGGTPDGNQGATQIANGWRLYDLYKSGAPTGVRTYVLFMKDAIYDNFGDRTEATHVEFDFLAKAMPVWEYSRNDGLGDAFACYGLSFSLADTANSNKSSNVVVGGIMNTAEGLVFVVKTDEPFCIPLLKEDGTAYRVGDQFRVGMTWELNGDVVLTINGRDYERIIGMSRWLNAVGDRSFVLNLLRKPDTRVSGDDLDIYITNMAFGRAHSNINILNHLTFDDIRNKNEFIDAIDSDLTLPTFVTNGQLEQKYDITWTSSNNDVVNAATGKVTRPATGVTYVELTASLENGETKIFGLVILGETTSSGNTMVVTNDTNPFSGKAVSISDYLFTLDTSNNSVVYYDGTEKTINHIWLNDMDSYSRLNRESLRLFVSSNNSTYTEIEEYKLLDVNGAWLLYDFEATGKYFKVHYTHFDGEEADFINAPDKFISVGWDETLEIPADAAEIPAPATTLRDEAVAIPLPAGITTQGLRITQNGKFLYFYVASDGTVYARIPDAGAGSLKLWNAEGTELADKENVYEVTYGTRETTLSGGRWVMTLPAGTKFPDGSVLEKETIYAMHGTVVNISTDGGYTWTKLANVQNNAPAGKTAAPPISCGGWGFDSRTGRLLYEAYTPEGTLVFNGADKTKSSCETHIIGSDDGGKTWYLMDTLGHVAGDEYSYYVLSYSEIVELRGNDGSGPNVDFVVNMGSQYNNNGAFCGRVAYTKDGGFNWSYSESLITFGNEYAFEGGISECTILEREDGTLVLYARCQSSGVDNFAMAYSLDHGVTWTAPGLKSGIYTVNTQPLMYKYDLDGDGIKEASVFLWGGNNMQGGNSYIRNPLNYAVSTNGMDTFRNIQNSFAETFMEVYTQAASHYITNASGHMVNGDDMYVAFGRLKHGDSVYMHINNFDDWFTRTKGAYDSFEHGTARYEGWVPYKGSVTVSNDMASEGKRSMRVAEYTNVTRSVPYLQNGQVSMDIYVDATTSFTVELQPAYTSVVGKGDIVTFTVEGTTLKLLNGAAVELVADRWNTITLDLELTEGKASVTANGVTKTVPVDLDMGDYVCYITLNSVHPLNLDALLVTSELDAVTVATEEDKTAANAVIDLIKAIGDVTAADAAAIQTARNAYQALTPAQRDLVNRRIRLSEADSDVRQNKGDDISSYMINYYEVLVAAEKAVANLLPGFGINLVLNETIDMNLIPKNGVALEGNVISLTYADGSVAEYTIASVNGSPAVRHSFNADQMSQTVTIQIFDAQGTPLTKELTISVRDYVAKLLSVTQNDTEKALMIRLLDYGALAQIYGAREAGETVQAADLANSIITSDLRTFMNSYDMGTPESYNPNMVSTGGTFSANLTLNESVDLNVYVNPAKMLDNEKIVVKLGDKVLTEGQYKQGITADGKISIRYSFNADAMNEELTVALADETSGEIRISLSMSVRKLAYVSMANYSSDTVLCATFAALLDYGALAQQYGGTNTTDLANRYVTADQRKLLTDYPWPN